MEGATIHWFNLLLETEDDLSWQKLKKALIARYGGRRLENPFEELSTLCQTRSVEEYVEAFEFLSSMAKDIDDELRKDDDDGDRRLRRKGIVERLGQKDWAGSAYKNRSGSNLNTKESNRVSNSERRFNNSDRWKGARGMESDEVIERRAKGLCFKCGGIWHPTTYKCPEKNLRVLILGGGESIDEEGEIITMEAVKSDEEVEEAECKVIDSGASHNFISPKVTAALGLPVTSTAVKSIRLGDGHRVMSQGV
ncbi:hypothetical protein L195_g048758 [Trifolium pratense]|uniref:Retrotransposon gag domain-containing protein n=1 Tax=Trifolium pratense TaxID=57577 RepID=A0A2K3JM67_TRIPR|nr:hypothetical protein L195_g048758 [Trifolium pratense]